MIAAVHLFLSNRGVHARTHGIDNGGATASHTVVLGDIACTGFELDGNGARGHRGLAIVMKRGIHAHVIEHDVH